MSQSFPQGVLRAIRSAIGTAGRVALHEPSFAGREWEYVKDCLDSTFVSSVGAYVERFEAALAEYTGVRRAVAAVNGTAALHVALRLAGVGPGDEVLLPALTFVASANAVAYCGAVPHFVDSDEWTLGVDAAGLAAYLAEVATVRDGAAYNRGTGRRLAALVPVHVFGHPADLEPLAALCDQYRLVLVEDCAESLGSLYRGRHTGHWGRLAALSFNGNKVITTGGGGAILTNDTALADRAKHITQTAKQPHRWAFFHDELGFNYRMPNLNAALGCAQLERIDALVEAKRRLAARYHAAFAGVEGCVIFAEQSYARSNYWLNALVLAPDRARERERILEATNADGVMTRPVWTLMNRLPMYRDCPSMTLTGAEGLEARIVNLPSSPALGM